MHDEVSFPCAFLGEKMGTLGVGFDWWRAVDVFLRKCLVDRGLSCIDRVWVVSEPCPGNVGGEMDTANRIAFLFPLAVSMGLWFWMNDLPGFYFFIPAIVFGLGLIMPLSFLMCNPRHPSTWL